MKAILVDTDILIEILRGHNDEIALRWAELVESETLLFYSPVTAAEVFHGIRPSEQSGLEMRLQELTCVPLDCEVGRRSGEYLRRFHGSHNLETADALIASTASVHGMQLWTRNRKHFPMKDIALL